MDSLHHILTEYEKKAKVKRSVKETFLTEHPDYNKLVKNCKELNKILKRMRKDFKPRRDLELYKDEIYNYISYIIMVETEKK